MLQEAVKPDDYEMSKWLLGIISLLIGLFASQLIELGKKAWKNREVRTALRDELEVLGDQLRHLTSYYADEVQNYVVGFSRGQFPVFPNCRVFEKLYPDILIKLKKEERVAYDSIHSLLDDIRARYQREIELSSQAKINDDYELFNRRGSLVQAQFLNCGLLTWRVDYALKNPSNPYVENSQAAMAELSAHREAIKEEMNLLVKQARQFPPKDFVSHKDYSSTEFYRRDEDTKPNRRG